MEIGLYSEYKLGEDEGKAFNVCEGLGEAVPPQLVMVSAKQTD